MGLRVSSDTSWFTTSFAGVNWKISDCKRWPTYNILLYLIVLIRTTMNYKYMLFSVVLIPNAYKRNALRDQRPSDCSVIFYSDLFLETNPKMLVHKIHQNPHLNTQPPVFCALIGHTQFHNGLRPCFSIKWQLRRYTGIPDVQTPPNHPHL